MYHQEIKQKAIDLRKEGYSYNYIVKHLLVTKSTLSDWLKDIPFTPKIIKFAIKWFKTCFEISTKQFRIRLFLYPDNNEKKCIKFWSKNTGIPINNFHTSIIDRRINKKSSNHGKLPFGTARVSVIGLGNKRHSTYLHRLVMALINQVL